MTDAHLDSSPDLNPPVLKLVADHDAVAQRAGATSSGRRSRPAPSPVRVARAHASRNLVRVRRAWLRAIFLPVFVAFAIIDIANRVADRLSREQDHERELTPTFARPAAMPTGDARSVGDIVGVIEAFPYEPPARHTQVTFFHDNGPDAFISLFNASPGTSTRVRRYPPAFQQRLFTGADGVQLVGMQALHEHIGPALIICHGLTMTKNFDLVLQLAKRAYEVWGFHVVTLDLRGWGQTSWTTDAPSAAGFHEGRDVVAIARELHQSKLVTSVGALGFSLGGSTVLNAAHQSSISGDSPLDGGVVALSAPTELYSALDGISRTPNITDPFWGLSKVFRTTVHGTVRREGLRRDIHTWRELVEEVSVPYYGISYEQYCAQASAVNFAGDVTVPTLAIHAEDDFLIPVSQAYQLRDAAADNPNLHVIVQPRGAHISFEAAEPKWFLSTVRRWFEYWATPGEYTDDDGF